MSNNKQSSVRWAIEELVRFELGTSEFFSKTAIINHADRLHKEEVKNSYISGYLDNGYYEGAEEDAAKLWEDTYGFVHNETFNNHETK